MIEWRLVFKQDYKFLGALLKVPRPPAPVIIPRVFNSSETDLAIQISSRKTRDSWIVAGTLTQVLIDFPHQAIGDVITVNLHDNQVLNLSDKGSRFQLKYTPVKWLDSVTISLWSPTMPLSQSLPSNSISSVSTVSQKTVTSTVISLLSANTSRSGLIIYNNSAKSVYIGYSNAVTVANASIIIPANSFWELSSPVYTGEVWAIAATGQTATLNITEFS